MRATLRLVGIRIGIRPVSAPLTGVGRVENRSENRTAWSPRRRRRKRSSSRATGSRSACSPSATGSVVSPDELADALWGESPPATWPKQVQICVGRLRKDARRVGDRHGAGRIPAGARRRRARHGSLRAARRARTCACGDRRADPGRDRLLRGRWRCGGDTRWRSLDGWPPGRSEAARLEELRRTIEEDLLDARLAAGEHRQVAVDAEALVAEEPWRERRWAILALARYRCGRQADALESIRIARRTLAEQLGLDPSAELAALELSILRQDPALAAPPEPATVERGVPVQGPRAVRRGRRGELLRPRRRRRRLPRAVADALAGRPCRTVRVREVVAAAGGDRAGVAAARSRSRWS